MQLIQRQHEIIDLNHRLEQFNIRFSTLVQQSPSDDTDTLLQISRAVAEDEQLLRTLNLERQLPVGQLLASHEGISRKMLRDYQQYIVAMAIIYSGPYPILREYLSSGLLL